MHFLWSVKKKTKSVAEMRYINIFSKHRFCHFCTDHKKCYFLRNFCMNVENLYIFVPNYFQTFSKCFHIFNFAKTGAYAPGSQMCCPTTATPLSINSHWRNFRQFFLPNMCLDKPPKFCGRRPKWSLMP